MTVAPEERLAAAKAKLDQPRAESFKFERAGDEIAGVVERLDIADTDYGTCKIVVLRTADGALRSIWLFHDALLSQMEKIMPVQGDVIAVRYNGKVTSEKTSRVYHAYTVTTDRERPQFSWDAEPAEAGSQGGEDGWPAEPGPSDDVAPY